MKEIIIGVILLVSFNLNLITELLRKGIIFSIMTIQNFLPIKLISFAFQNKSL